MHRVCWGNIYMMRNYIWEIYLLFTTWRTTLRTIWPSVKQYVKFLRQEYRRNLNKLKSKGTQFEESRVLLWAGPKRKLDGICNQRTSFLPPVFQSKILAGSHSLQNLVSGKILTRFSHFYYILLIVPLAFWTVLRHLIYPKYIVAIIINKALHF